MAQLSKNTRLYFSLSIRFKKIPNSIRSIEEATMGTNERRLGTWTL